MKKNTRERRQTKAMEGMEREVKEWMAGRTKPAINRRKRVRRGDKKWNGGGCKKGQERGI